MTILKLLSKIPSRVQYRISDWLIFPTLYYLVRYRRKLVAKNLLLSFPEKTETERHSIEKQFYHYLADVVVEMIYGYGAPEEEMEQRIVFHNQKDLLQLVEQSESIIFMLAHLGNWEWLTHFNLPLETVNAQLASVYREQNNKHINNSLRAMRSRWGGILIEKRTILRQLLLLRKQGQKIGLGLICDQKPRPEVTRLWTTFLHQETGFLDGGEVLSKKYNYPVVYAYIRRPKRGYYDITFELLTDKPQETDENEITLKYAQRLEQNIKDQPEIWLWTHNRWKWARPIDKKLQ